MAAEQRLLKYASVPSFLHNFVIELFRNSGELARELLGEQVELPVGELIAKSSPTDFSQAIPTEYRVDHVTAYYRPDNLDGPPAFAIIIEVQHKLDEGKRWRWPAYVANAAASLKCHVMLLVVTWDAAIANWARGPFTLGPPGFDLRPCVIDLSKLPRLHSPDMVPRIPELAVLCALAHPNATSAKAAIATLRELPSDLADLYLQAIINALSPIEARIMEEQMIEERQMIEEFGPGVELYFRVFPRLCEHLAQIIEKQVIEKVREDISKQVREDIGKQVREDISKQVREEGDLIALQEVALKMVRAKLGDVLPADEAAIRELQDVGILSSLLVELGLADGAEKVRAVLAHAAMSRSPERRSTRALDDGDCT